MPKKISSTPSALAADKPVLILSLVLAISLFLFMFRLGDRPFRNPDEGRYAAIAREMVVSGDWGIPTLFGLPYLKKPILFYWLVAGSFSLFGLSEWAARLVPALFGVAGVWMVFAFCLKFFDRRMALMAALLVASNFWYLQVGRYLVIDMVFTFFLIAAAFSFFIAHSARNPSDKRFYYVFFIALGFAFITKGPVSLAVTALPVLVYVAMKRQLLRTVTEMRWVPGLLLFGLVALPWFAWVANRQPHFFGLFFGHENWNRVFSSSFEHQEPWYFYYLLIVPMLVPWILFLRPLDLARAAAESEETRPDPRLYLFIFGVATLFFYSLAKAKLPTYILPAVVYFMIPMAYGWRRWIAEERRMAWGEAWPVALLMLAGIGIIVVTPWYVLERSPGKFPARIVEDFQLLGGVLLAGGVFCARSIRQNRRGRLFFSLAGIVALISLTFPYAMETMNPNYSTKAFAQALEGRLGAQDEVYVYDQPGAFYDFGFYLDRPVKLVGLEGELEFSRTDKNAPRVSVSRDAFLRMLAEGKELTCLIRRSDYVDIDPMIREKLVILREDTRKVLFRSGSSKEDT